MRTFEIEDGKEPLMGDISNERESDRMSFGMIAVMGESLMRHLFQMFFFTFF